MGVELAKCVSPFHYSITLFIPSEYVQNVVSTFIRRRSDPSDEIDVAAKLRYGRCIDVGRTLCGILVITVLLTSHIGSLVQSFAPGMHIDYNESDDVKNCRFVKFSCMVTPFVGNRSAVP